MRTRDAGITSVKYDNDLFRTAFTLNEALVLERPRSHTLVNGLASIFDDGRYSLQGSVAGARFTPTIPLRSALTPSFSAMRGEAALQANSTAQHGTMPTLQLVAEGRTHFLNMEHGVWLGGGVAHTFDGERWRTTMLGESGGWLRRGGALFTASFKPMQLQYGDVLADAEWSLQLRRGSASLDASLGVRLAEALRGTVGWGGVSASFVLLGRYLTTLSVGSYPTDLLQGLPGGRYVGVSIRVPRRTLLRRTLARNDSVRVDSAGTNGSSGSHAKPVAMVLDGDGEDGALVLSVANGGSSADVRMVRVRVSGAQRVEVMADFTEWEPVHLVQGLTGEWEAKMRIPAGPHRLNVRVDGGEWLVPTNVARVTDEFNGLVGVIVLP